jgi:hypothetical protein
MAQAIASLDNLVREELPAMIYDAQPAIAPIFEKIKRTAFGVKKQDGIGRGYKVIHLYETGVAGLMESGDPLGPDMTTIQGTQSNVLAQGTAQSKLAIFPAAEESPHTGDIKRELVLHKVVGNFSVPVEWKQADMLNAAQIKKVGRDMKAVAKLKAIYEASSFFSHSVTNDAGYQNQVVGRLSAIAEHATWTDYIVCTIDEQYGRISNFLIGMRLDIVADSTGTLQAGVAADGTDVRNYTHTGQQYVHLVVVDVDFLGKKFTLRPINSVTGALPNYGSSSSGDVFQNGQAGAANDWLVFANTSRYIAGTRPQFSWGINDWIKNTGTIMGGATGAAALDVDVYSQFKSPVIAVNGPLTDDVINGYIGGYLDAYPGESLDTIITTMGVQLEWLKQPGLYNNRQNYERTGKSVNFRGGWSSISYEFGGRVYDWVISPMCLSKTLYGMKFAGDNIKRYGPPRIGGSEASMGPEIEFLATLGGHTGIFMVSRSSGGRPQDLLESPFWYHNLIAPVDPRGLKFTGLTEATMLG